MRIMAGVTCNERKNCSLSRGFIYEDMYVQASEHFPGILLDMEKRTLRFSMEKFISEFEETTAHFDEP